MKTAAFFDVDKTLVSVNTANIYSIHKRKLKQISLQSRLRSIYWMIQYQFNIMDMTEIVLKTVHSFKCKREDELFDFCNELFELYIKQYISENALKMVNNHRKKNHKLVILSASTIHMIQPVAKLCGIEHILCNEMEVENQRFTGKCIEPICYGPGKLYWARKFCLENDVKLSESYFYSDSFSDKTMFDAVKYPVAVNPDRKLLNYSKKHNWPIEIT